MRPDGIARWVFAQREPKFDENDQPTVVSGVVFDIDSRKRIAGVREELLTALAQ